jgi:hypothetical protein
MKLSFSAYCGMTYDIDSGDDIRKAAAKFIRRRRNNGQTVVKLRDNVWECQEPILVISRIVLMVHPDVGAVKMELNGVPL